MMPVTRVMLKIFVQRARGASTSSASVASAGCVPVADMNRQLRAAGCTVEDGHACLLSTCRACKPKRGTGSLYINKTTGFFSCSGCRHRGSWTNLAKLLARKKHPCDEEECPEVPYSAWKEAECRSQSLTDSNGEEILRKFHLPVIRDASKLLQDVRVSEDHERLLFPLRDVSGRVTGMRILQRTPSEDLPDERCQGEGLLQLGAGPAATLVGSAADALALMAARAPGAALCVPAGFRLLPQELLPQLERFPRLVLWPPAEMAEQARAAARKLGERRCLLVRGAEPPLRASRGGTDVRGLVLAARPVWHKAITSFSTLREDIFADLRNIDKVEGVKWKRFPALSRLLRGHRRGELTVLTGPTGCGKTTFCSEYSLDLAMQGVVTLWGSFEISNSRLARTMLQQLAAVSLHENIHLFDV